ncbi:tetratricopeptide repeat protein [Luteolibacter sp. AS25]|uniref:tetratricopeptide repeat protein n=1 Tax=Luteolibacter sp. AS25 TaxID=3135776 RepID=UPI00398B1172
MKFHFLTCAALFGVFAQLALSENSKDSPDANELVKKLSSDSFQERELATKLLWEKGDGALELLEGVADSDDPEAVLRATEILDLLELGLTPESPKEIFALIEKYREGGKDEKLAVFSDLKRRRAYRQLLVLYSKEPPEIQAEFGNLVRGVAIVGAREAIFQNDSDTAVKLLRIAPNEPSTLMALASMYVSDEDKYGKFEAIEPPENVSSELWMTTLLRAKGDIPEAAKLAATTNQVELFATLEMLQGDPTHWIRLKDKDPENRQAMEVYKKLALKRWGGEDLEDADFETLASKVNSRDDDERERSMMLLALLGRLGEFEDFQDETDSTASFVYYLSQERIPEALKIMGLDPDSPDYATWLGERMDRILGASVEETDDFDLILGNEIAQVSGFLERRGLGEVLSQALTGPLEKMASKDESRFLSFLEQYLLNGGSAPEFSLQVAANWAGENEGRWQEVYRISLGEDTEALQWLEWVNKMKPDQSRMAALQATRALLGLSFANQDLRSEWFDIGWQAINQMEGEDQKQLATRFLGLATTQNDTENALRIFDLIGQSVAWRSIDRYLSAAGRWKEAVVFLEKSPANRSSSSPEIHAFMAANYRRAGMEEQARAHDEWVERLTLGLPQSCLINAKYYTYGGDYERAAIWKKKAVEMADPEDNSFVAVLDDYAKSMMDAEEWDISSSCYEGVLHIYAMQRYLSGSLLDYARVRLKADLTKALSVIDEDRARAVSLLEGSYLNFPTDGILADDFFPIMRKAGLEKELEEWFAQSWGVISEVIMKYPASENTRNTAGWLASRAGLNLEEAEEFLRPVLEQNPNQPAYLDTMAELQFAQGKRKEAVEWSNRAVMFMPQIDQQSDVVIRAQNDRFKNGRLPE